jgi:D-amino-acid dehydrogenase
MRNVAVVGAGIVGMCTAAYLQRSGAQVTVFDPVDPGKSCSYGNAGGLSPGSCIPVAYPGIIKQVPGWLFDPMAPLVLHWRYLPKALPWLLRFIKASTREQFEHSASALSAIMSPVFDSYQPLLAEAKAEHLVRRLGQIYVYETEAAFKGDALGWDVRRRHGSSFEVLSADELRHFEPNLAPIFVRGVRIPGHGYCANPLGLVEAIAGTVRNKGGSIVPQRVLDIEVDADGVKALITTGGRHQFDAVVIAAGAWSHELARKLGHKVPLETQRGYHAMLAAPSTAPHTTIMWVEKKFMATPMEHGLRFAGTVELAGLNAPPDYRRADVLLNFGKQMFPGLQGGEVSRWMGHRPCLPDSLPVIGRSPNVRNAYFAFGHGHLGLSAASTTGRVVAELVTGATPNIDLTPYRIDRF